MKYKHLLFDWDGTLVDSLQVWVTAIGTALKNRNVSLRDKQIVSQIVIDMNAFTMSGLGVHDFEPFLADVLGHRGVKEIHMSALHERVDEVIRELYKRHKKLGVISNSTKPILELAFAHQKMGDYFDACVTRDMVKRVKPHPDPVLLGMHLIGGSPENTLMVGDSAVDIAAGRAAGLKTAIHYPRSHERWYDYEYIKETKADYILRDFSDLLDMV